MARVRLAALAALLLVLVQPAITHAAPDPGSGGDANAQAVSWPASDDWLVAEVVTGGASASDEYVELTNASTEPADLLGLELVYVTSTGSTVTRKTGWDASVLVAPGRHVLIANSAGLYASVADATYSGGLAAAGGTIVLRPAGGAPIDSVGWGTARNEFVEGAAAPAPPAGSSIERRPGGAAGNTSDSNDNAADFVLNDAPEASNLAADPSPPPSSPTPAPTATPTPTTSPAPTPTASPAPTPTWSSSPIPTATPSPLPTESSSPIPTATPSTSPAASPTPTASQLTSIHDARSMPDGARVSVQGALTTALGALEGGRTSFIQDDSGGIALYLDAVVANPVAAGAVVLASGEVGSRYGQRTLRISEADLLLVRWADLPPAVSTPTGSATEPLEGWRLDIRGTVTESPSSLSDGLGMMVDDGTGPLRVVVAPDALDGLTPITGSSVRVLGPLGQRDSSGTGTAGYRLYATLPGELELALPTPSSSPTPSPTTPPAPSPTATPSVTLSPSPSPAPSPSPTPTADPSPASVTIAAARAMPVGAGVRVRGVVVAEAGRLGTPPLFAIADATGGIVVRLPDPADAPTRGTLLEVSGRIADPYGQVELRPVAAAIADLGTSDLPAPARLSPAAIGEGTEGRLVMVSGTITMSAARATSGDISFTIGDGAGATLAVRADASAGLDKATFRKGMRGTFTGFIGQRASRKGRLDGYRLWLRDASDVALDAASPTASPRPSRTSSARPTPSTIAKARVGIGRVVTVEGVLTVDRTLLDSTGRRTIVEDASGAIEVYLPASDDTLRLGQVVRVTGTVGRAWNAPRLKAERVAITGARQPVAHVLRGRPSAATEWLLVRVSGRVAEVHRSGDRWTAELETAAGRIPIQGLAGSGIPSTALIEGRAATITGIVKRPYPTAKDRRFSIVPRRASDVALGPASGSGSATRPSASHPLGGSPEDAGGGSAQRVIDVDLRDLALNAGRLVRVGGLVTTVEQGRFQLDDGTAVRVVRLEGGAGTLLARLRPGDALNATGTPEAGDPPVLVVSDPAAIELAGDLVAMGPVSVASGSDGADGNPTRGEPDPAAVAAIETSMSGRGAPATVQLGIALSLLLAIVLSTLATAAVRRRQARRQLEARIKDRLATVAGRRSGELEADPLARP
jgi:uncharacterized protein YdeI (BOF family)